MIYTLVNEIRKDKDKIRNFIKDNYKVKEGLYLKVNIDESFNGDKFKDYLIVGDNNRFLGAKGHDKLDNIEELQDYFIERNIMSRLMNDDANKALDVPKKRCLSTVYLTLCVARKTSPFNDIDLKKKPFKKEGQVAEHFNSVVFPKYIDMGGRVEKTFALKSIKKDHGYVDEFLNTLINKAKEYDRLNAINNVSKYVTDNLDDILKFAETLNLKSDTVIKIFFYSPSQIINDSLENYQLEESLYTASSLVNQGDVIYSENSIKCAISTGYNYNDNKILQIPRCMNFSRLDYITFSDALDYKTAHDLLKVINDNNSSRAMGFNKLTTDNQFSTDIESLSDVDDKSLIFKLNFKEKFIEDYNIKAYVSHKPNTIGYMKVKCVNFLNPTFGFKKFTQDKTDGVKLTDTFTIRELVSFTMFCWSSSLAEYGTYNKFGIVGTGGINLENKCEILFNRYKTSVNDILNEIYIDGQYIGESKSRFMKSMIDTYIKEYALTMHQNKNCKSTLTDLLNIKLNILNKIAGECEEIMLLDTIKEKRKLLSEGEFNIETDEEFYFTLGQLVYYVECQSGKDVDFSVFKYYAAKKKDEALKDYLTQRLQRFAHKISVKDRTFKVLYAAIMNYKPNKSINTMLSIFYMGICSDNMILGIKKEKADEKKELKNTDDK